MHLLPPQTPLPQSKTGRLHSPEPARDYVAFRQCLRWDFSFTCAFCLLHEADLAIRGVEGWGLIGVEHFVAQSLDSDRITEYANCYLCCARCNSAKWKKPPANLVTGGKLLDPCEEPWALHFAWEAGELIPKDVDAEWTIDAYNLNDRSKVARRVYREAFISRKLTSLKKWSANVATLTRLFDEITPIRQVELVRLLAEANEMRQEIRQDLQNYLLVPIDARQCSCQPTPVFSTPLYSAAEEI
jgi:5-methylcytosine-specific restriction endonuclease McrA